MNLTRRLAAVSSLVLVTGLLASCSSQSGEDATPSPTEVAEPAVNKSDPISITAKDYAFDMPTNINGGLVTFDYSNAGSEPHFGAFAKIGQGKTAADVKAALLTPPGTPPPPGPPPFEDIIGFATADPGVSGTFTGDLPGGEYLFYCAIPSPDGVPHAAKGMISEVTVSDGARGELPAAAATVEAKDFGFSSTPKLTAGTNVLKLNNQGNQIHELALAELASGKTVDDLSKWSAAPAGPPPAKFLQGVAVKPGEQATAEFIATKGGTYAFVCIIPDFLGDFAPHITKGMRSAPFTVT